MRLSLLCSFKMFSKRCFSSYDQLLLYILTIILHIPFWEEAVHNILKNGGISFGIGAETLHQILLVVLPEVVLQILQTNFKDFEMFVGELLLG